MPESSTVEMFEIEANYTTSKPGAQNQPSTAPSEYGHLKFVPECTADQYGTHSTVTVHHSADNNPIFHWPLSREPGGLVNKSVKLKEYYKQQGLTGLAEDVLNKLDICGHAYSIARGKEPALIISNNVRNEHWIVRYHFGTEGHIFGLPTTDIQHIMASPPVKRPSVERSKAFKIPLDLCKGPKTDPLVSILATFERPKWSLAFVNHNVMLTMHVMRL
ncbi:hypothetical protein EV715DRAFT_297699 [Schizophyllum commune]